MSKCLLILAAAAFSFGCVTRAAETVKVSASTPTNTVPTPTPAKIEPSISSLSASSLCDRLGEIENIDGRVPEDSDDLYKAIMAKGSEALPCLVDKINERTKTRDPRNAPVWGNYVVGDTAVFTTLHIIIRKGDDGRWEELMLSSLPTKYREEWETNGVYAYFNYVYEPKNRKALQKWWKDRLKANTR
jgi:hypothetical protein